MFSLDDLEKIKEILAQSGLGNNKISGKKDDKCDKKDNGKEKKDCLNLTPSQLFVIAGLISGALEVESVLVDKSQGVEILLTGSLKRKTQLEKIMEQIGAMPFEDVVGAIMSIVDS